jgi:hypothetical protein
VIIRNFQIQFFAGEERLVEEFDFVFFPFDGLVIHDAFDFVHKLLPP